MSSHTADSTVLNFNDLAFLLQDDKSGKRKHSQRRLHTASARALRQHMHEGAGQDSISSLDLGLRRIVRQIQSRIQSNEARVFVLTRLREANDGGAMVKQLLPYLRDAIAGKLLVIDAQFPAPGFSRFYAQLDNSNPGLSDLLAGQLPLARAFLHLPNTTHYLLLQGKRHLPNQDVHRTAKVRRLLRFARALFDTVIVDHAALGPGRLQSPWIANADAAFMFASRSHNTRKEVSRFRRIIQQQGCSFEGTLM